MPSLYEIVENIEMIIETGFSFDEETGEIIFDESDLDALSTDLDEKINACGMWIKNRRSLAEAIKNEEAALKKRRETIEREVSRMTDYVMRNIEKLPDKRFESPECDIRVRRSSRVEVYDEKMIPDEFVSVVTSIKPDKSAIKKAIKSGAHVPGAMVVQNEILQIR